MHAGAQRNPSVFNARECSGSAPGRSTGIAFKELEHLAEFHVSMSYTAMDRVLAGRAGDLRAEAVRWRAINTSSPKPSSGAC
jgi:hypothetical protein